MSRFVRGLAAGSALALLLVLGIDVSAVSAQRPSTRPYTTTSTTTTTTTTSSATTTSTGSVQIFSPANGAATIRYKGETLSAQVSDPAPSPGSAACTIDWGDGSGASYTATEVAPGVYRCGVVHYWTSSGWFTITVTGVDGNGVVGSSSSLLYVF